MEACMSTTSLPPSAESSASSDIEWHIEELRREAAAYALENDACLFVHYSDVLHERASSLLRCDASATLVLKKFNVDFKHLHLICLRPRQWLNDEVVNLFMQLSQERDSAITRSTLYPRNPNLFMNSFFYLKLAQEEGGFNYSNVKRWTKNIDIFTCNQIFFPINFKEEHWALVCVSMLRKKILYLDSVSRSGRIITENILKWLQEESLSRTKKPLSSFSVEDVCCPQQSNSYDCGIFILAFVDLLANDLPVDIMQQSLCDNLRLSLCIWIVRGRLGLPRATETVHLSWPHSIPPQERSENIDPLPLPHFNQSFKDRVVKQNSNTLTTARIRTSHDKENLELKNSPINPPLSQVACGIKIAGSSLGKKENFASTKSAKPSNRMKFPSVAINLHAAESIVANNGKCCKRGNCFVKELTQWQAAHVVRACRMDLVNTPTKSDLINKLRDKVNYCTDKCRDGSLYLKMKYRVIPESKSSFSMDHLVCAKTFRAAWNISKSLIKTLRRQVKKKIVKSSHAFTDRYSAVDGDIEKMLKDTGLDKFVDHPERLLVAKVPNTTRSEHLYTWMKGYFELIGDDQPALDEVHLDPIDKKDIYTEYVKETIYIDGLKPLSKSRFEKMWLDCFSHVKIREYKACTGKCSVCADLSELGRTLDTKEAMQFLKTCRFIHRADFMSDRLLYGDRKKQSQLYPSQYLSLITDGMQQTHCELPYSGNAVPHPNKVKQHLQGVTSHYRRTKMYRTLDHVQLGANACIYTLLLAIEEEFFLNGKLPRIVYIQIDGGSENANWAFLAWMEILIFLRIGAEEILVSRMRSGHNHADQDGKFGLFWRAIRTEYFLEPQRYAKRIAEVLSEKSSDGTIRVPAELVEIFAVPDLVALVQPYLSSKLSGGFKKDKTQLVYKFEKVPISESFPLGSRCTYRASALDEFYEFVPDPTSPIGKRPRKVVVKWHPEGGARFLNSIPTSFELGVQEFPEGSVEHMLNIIQAIKDASHSVVKDKWTEYQKSLPFDGEDAATYAERIGMRIPFKEILASRRANYKDDVENLENFQSRGVLTSHADYSVCLPDVAAGACLRWEGCLKPEPSRVTIHGRIDATFPEQKLKRTAKINWRIDPKSLVEGSTLFVPACTWSDYEEHWPYTFPLKEAYVRGICLEIDLDKKSFTMSFPAFNLECSKSFKYLNKFCYILMPEGGNEITEELFNEFEARKHSKANDIKPVEVFDIGDILFIKATAWESSTYRNIWPYDVDISMSYFEAVVESILKEKKFRLSFVAFEIDGRSAEFARSFLGKFAVKKLPVGARVISREMYEEIEHEKIDGQINDLDVFEAEKHNTAFVRRTRLAVKKRSRGEEVLPKDFSEDVGPQLPEPPMIVPNLVTTISTNDGVQEEVLPLPSVVRRTRSTALKGFDDTEMSTVMQLKKKSRL